MKNINLNRLKVVLFDIIMVLAGFGMIVLGVIEKAHIVASVQDTVLLGIFMILFGIVFVGKDLE